MHKNCVYCVAVDENETPNNSDFLQSNRRGSVLNSCSITAVCNNNHHLTVFIKDKLGKPAPELSETLIQYTTFIVLELLTSTPNLTVCLLIQIRTWVKQPKEMQRTRGQESTFPWYSPILDLMRPSLVPSHSRLSLYDH